MTLPLRLIESWPCWPVNAIKSTERAVGYEVVRRKKRENARYWCTKWAAAARKRWGQKAVTVRSVRSIELGQMLALTLKRCVNVV